MAQYEIIQFLSQHKQDKFTASQLSVHIGINKSSCTINLAKLRRCRAVRFELMRAPYGRQRIFYYWLEEGDDYGTE